MCGGVYETTKKPRPLYEINNETLLNRTIRLLRELGINDIAISVNKDNNLFDDLDIEVLKIDNNYKCVLIDNNLKHYKQVGYWCDAFYYTDEPVCYLMGDVFYSKAALKQIVDIETNDILFFGTDKPFAKGYNKWYEEPLAFKVVNQDKLHKACDKFRELQDMGPNKWPFHRQPISWDLVQIICGSPLNTVVVHTPIFVGIHDFASDIDNEYDAIELNKIVKEYNY